MDALCTRCGGRQGARLEGGDQPGGVPGQAARVVGVAAADAARHVAPVAAVPAAGAEVLGAGEMQAGLGHARVGQLAHAAAARTVSHCPTPRRCSGLGAAQQRAAGRQGRGSLACCLWGARDWGSQRPGKQAGHARALLEVVEPPADAHAALAHLGVLHACAKGAACRHRNVSGQDRAGPQQGLM